jgi:hypothetical protein
MTHPAPTGDPTPFDAAMREYAEACYHHDADAMRAGYVKLRDLFAAQFVSGPAPMAVSTPVAEALLQLECAVMNLPSDARKQYPQIAAAAERAAYLIGHREVRHAAAGLIAATAAALRSAPRVVLTEEPWQPIETAPKDGPYILLSDGTRTSVGGWVSDIDQGAEYEGQLGMAGWWWLESSHECKPTVWRPLPTPPAGIGTGSKTP